MIRMHYSIVGRVQGVGFRYTAFRAASKYRLTGFVKNEYDGSVTMEMQGEGWAIGAALQEISEHGWIRIDALNPEERALVKNEGGFQVLGLGI